MQICQHTKDLCLFEDHISLTVTRWSDLLLLGPPSTPASPECVLCARAVSEVSLHGLASMKGLSPPLPSCSFPQWNWSGLKKDRPHSHPHPPPSEALSGRGGGKREMWGRGGGVGWLGGNGGANSGRDASRVKPLIMITNWSGAAGETGRSCGPAAPLKYPPPVAESQAPLA